MLKIILQAIQERVTPEVKKMLSLLQKPLSRREIMHRMKLSDEKHFRQFYLHSAIKAGLIEMTVPDHPRSRLQKYRLTPTARKLLAIFLSITLFSHRGGFTPLKALIKKSSLE